MLAFVIMHFVEKLVPYHKGTPPTWAQFWEARLPVTSQDKTVSDRGVTHLKNTLVQLAGLVVPSKGPLPGYGVVLNCNVGGGGDLRYGEVGGRDNPSFWGQ